MLLRMTKHAVVRADEVNPGRAKIVRLDGTEIGLFRLNDGSWRAYKNFCPHAGAPVCTGPVSNSTPQILRCPWHAWNFDLTTGQLVGHANCKLDSYQVEVADGTVFVWA